MAVFFKIHSVQFNITFTVYFARLISHILSNMDPEPALEPPEPPSRGGGPHDPQGPHVTAGQFF